jgi:hypothetical protein
MIQLEVKRAEVQGAAPVGPVEMARGLVALSILGIPGGAPIVLCQDRELVRTLEGQAQLVAQLAQHGRCEIPGLEIILRSAATYQPDRTLYDCLAVKVDKGQMAPTSNK